MSGLDLVTGGSGYLGSHVARSLAERGRRVRVLDLAAAAHLPPGAEFVQGDMADAAGARAALEGVDRIFHIAFVQSLSRRPESERHRINVGGMENLVAAALSAGAQRFVFASTIEIYGTRPPYPCTEDAPLDHPVGWYGLHKLLCERILWRAWARDGLPAVALRMPTICGRGFYNHRPMLLMMDRILAGKAMAVVGDGSTPGDFVAIEDVVDAFLAAGERPEAIGEAFNVSCARESTQRQIVEAMIAAVGSTSRVRRVPVLLARVFLRGTRLLGLHDLPAYQDDYIFNPNRYAVDKARRLLGYEPRHDAAEAAARLILGYRADREAVRQRAENY